jgi:transposase
MGFVTVAGNIQSGYEQEDVNSRQSNHTSESVCDKQCQFHILTMFMAPYSPFDNPIELMFGQIKQKIGKQRYACSIQLLTRIPSAVQGLIKKEFGAVMLHFL